MYIEQQTGDAPTARTAETVSTLSLAAFWRSDRAGILALALITLVAASQLFWGGVMIGQDSATQFYPWYDYLGERLRAGEVPGWNPFQFAGVPFAADPQSGWMYLPAMAIFAAFPLSTAVPVFIVFHLALAGTGTYLLSRLLGIGIGGALVAAVAYELAGPVYGRSVCCPAPFEIGSWMPLALVGAELALRTRDRAWRIIGWAISGLAVSQALGAWLGQGGYYFLLFLAAYIAYRALLAPADRGQRWPARFRDGLAHGGAIFSIGFGLAAAGILPRLEYIQQRSNVAGGEYGEGDSWASDIGGVTHGMVFDRLLEPGQYYPGVTVLVLAIAGLFLARGRYGSPFFFGIGICSLILATPWTTPLHHLLYAILPRFEQLHQHWPERVAIVSFLCLAVLSGAAVESLRRNRYGTRQLLLAAGIPIAAILALIVVNADVPTTPVVVTLLTIGIVASLMLPQWRWVRTALPALLVPIVMVDLLVAFNGAAAQGPYGGFHRVDFDEYYDPGGAVVFLRERIAEEPGRYIGFDDQHRAWSDGQLVLYRYQFASPETSAILVNNRGVLHGLEDAQGYNPVQPERFVAYLTALNGHAQEYHDANVYLDGIDSPLFDLLNIRYVVIPATYGQHRPDLAGLEREFPSIYADEDVRVLENPDAVPRAWIVHRAQEVEPDETLTLLESGEVDPRETALLETTPPQLAMPPDTSTSTARLVHNEPEIQRFETQADAPGLLMLSEPYDPNWRAYVDGEDVELYSADYLFRAVPIPAGDHVVELRYEPRSLRVGMAVSALTAAVVIPALAWSVRRCRR